MELTPYTKKLFDLSGVRPEDAWSDIYTWDGRGAMEDQPSHIKSNGSIGWRSTLCLRISPYGFAFAGKSGIFIYERFTLYRICLGSIKFNKI